MTGFYKGKIEPTQEFRRISGLPRRVWSEEDAAKLSVDMTNVLKTPKGTMTLKPIQAVALYEIGTYGGMFGPIPVGEGKTLISLLAAYVLDAKRPLLLLPANLITKTDRERIDLSRHFRIPLSIHVMSVESLGRVNKSDALETTLRPDLIIIDEAHKLKNKKAACTKRLVRYMKEHPETKMIVMSGTMDKRSLNDWAHLSHFSLKMSSPLPMNGGELMDWCEVLDDNQSVARVHPGALLELCNEEERKESPFSAARLGYQRRLLETPGVVSSKGADVPCSIYINGVTFPVNDITEKNFHKLRNKWRTPDDWPLVQAVDVWRHSCELALGFHYVWSPRPPREWLEIRTLWSKFVRNTLARSRRLDSPKQVELAVLAGEIEDTLYIEREGEMCKEENILARWKSVEKTFKANTVAVWHDDSALNFCQAWGEKNRGIIWTEHSFFGRELSRRTGWDYFGQKGVNAAEVPIDLPKAHHEGKTIIASRPSNGTGKNLQAWNNNLLVSPPGGPDMMEQTIARTHRPGQLNDEVNVDIVIACAENVDAWISAVEGAKRIHELMGSKQKVLLADVDLDVRHYQGLQGARWSKTLSEKDSRFVLPNFD